MWDYSEKVMDHYRNPRNVGKIDNADAVGQAGALSCGDELKIYLKIENNIIVDAKFQTFGCGSAVASSSILTEMIIGKTVEEALKVTNEDIAEELGGLPPEKMHCSVMGHEALQDALKNYTHTNNENVQEKIICTCFGVTERMIIEAITENNLTTLQDVTNYTKAGGACGRCKGMIQELLNKYSKSAASTLTPAQKILKVNKVIEEIIAPELQKDGGDIELIDIQDNEVYVKLHGRCSECKKSTVTLKAFVETTLKDKVSKDIIVIELKA